MVCLTWIEKDGHAFQDEQTMNRYYFLTAKCRLLANIGLSVALPLGALVFLLLGGVGQVIADEGTPNVPFVLLLSMGIFLAPSPILAYYSTKVTLLHDSEKMKCYVQHSKWRRYRKPKREEDEGPIRGPDLPFPSVKM